MAFPPNKFETPLVPSPPRASSAYSCCTSLQQHSFSPTCSIRVRYTGCNCWSSLQQNRTETNVTSVSMQFILRIFLKNLQHVARTRCTFENHRQMHHHQMQPVSMSAEITQSLIFTVLYMTRLSVRQHYLFLFIRARQWPMSAFIAHTTFCSVLFPWACCDMTLKMSITAYSRVFLRLCKSTESVSSSWKRTQTISQMSETHAILQKIDIRQTDSV